MSRIQSLNLNKKLKEKYPEDTILHNLFGCQQLLECKSLKEFKKKLKLSTTNTSIHIENCDSFLANAIRRILLKDVEIIAPHFVDMYNNTSAIPDEILTQRIGQIPVVGDPYDLEKLDHLDPNRLVEAIYVKSTLDFINKEKKNIEVYSRDIIFEDSQYKFVNDNIPIVTLKPNQQIKCDIYCIRGCGKQHAKWLSINVCAFEKIGNGYTIRFEPIECISIECLKKQVLEHLFDRVEKYYNNV